MDDSFGILFGLFVGVVLAAFVCICVIKPADREYALRHPCKHAVLQCVECKQQFDFRDGKAVLRPDAEAK